MPTYDAYCPKGHEIGVFQSYPDFDAGLPLICHIHNKKCKRLLSKPMIGGTSSFKMTKDEKIGLGRTFNSSTEMEAFCKANSFEKVDIDEDARRTAKIQKEKSEKAHDKHQKNLLNELNKHTHVDLGDGKIIPLSE